MKNYIAVLAWATLIGLTLFSWADDKKGSKHGPWEKNPKRSELQAPVDGLNGFVQIGRVKDKGPDGDPESIISKKFKCDDAGFEGGEYCTVLLIIEWVTADDEKLRIDLSDADGKVTQTIYPDPKHAARAMNMKAGREYYISVKPCPEVQLSAKFEDSKTSKKKNIQSYAEIKISTAFCTRKDNTNHDGLSLDGEGKPLPQPEGPIE